MKKQLKLAVKWEVKESKGIRSIQLFDKDGNKLRGSEARWEGDFYCYNNQLTTLKGSPKEVGGTFYCSNNKLVNEDHKSKTYSENSKLSIFNSKLKRGFVFVDGILTKLTNKKEVQDYTIYYTKKIGSNKKVFVIQTKDNTFSHGNTLKEALEDIKYKISDRNTEEYKTWKVADSKTKDELIVAYRKITGACIYGVKEFIKGKKLKDKMKVKDVIKLTNGEFGGEEFKSFFRSK